jgi:hypothetical protein
MVNRLKCQRFGILPGDFPSLLSSNRSLSRRQQALFFSLIIQRRQVLVNPAMHADLVLPRSLNVFDHLRVEEFRYFVPDFRVFVPMKRRSTSYNESLRATQSYLGAV